jgi:hypothetical protein
MEKQKKTILKLISFIIIALLVFQVIPTSISCYNGFKDNTQNTLVALSSGVINTDVLNISRESQKYPLLKLQLRNNILYISRQYQGANTDINFFYEIAIDNRTIIRRTIQNYFNGSKYKYNSLVI